MQVILQGNVQVTIEDHLIFHWRHWQFLYLGSEVFYYPNISAFHFQGFCSLLQNVIHSPKTSNFLHSFHENEILIYFFIGNFLDCPSILHFLSTLKIDFNEKLSI